MVQSFIARYLDLSTPYLFDRKRKHFHIPRWIQNAICYLQRKLWKMKTKLLKYSFNKWRVVPPAFLWFWSIAWISESEIQTLNEICTPVESFIKLKLRDFWLNKLKSAKQMKNSRKITMSFKQNFKLSFALGSWVTKIYNSLLIQTDKFHWRWLKFKNHPDMDDLSNCYLDSVVLYHLKWKWP